MEELILLGRQLWDNAEPGFFEFRTHAILSNMFKKFGFIIEGFDNIPGLIATIDGNYETKPIALISDKGSRFPGEFHLRELAPDEH